MSKNAQNFFLFVHPASNEKICLLHSQVSEQLAAENTILIYFISIFGLYQLCCRSTVD